MKIELLIRLLIKAAALLGKAQADYDRMGWKVSSAAYSSFLKEIDEALK